MIIVNIISKSTLVSSSVVTALTFISALMFCLSNSDLFITVTTSSVPSSDSISYFTNRNKVISICAAVMIVVSGGLFTVNAATDGKIAEGIKEELKGSNYLLITSSALYILSI